MKKNVWRIIIPVAVLLIITVGFLFHAGIGTLSDFGWESISLLCPLGALTSMLAAKIAAPRAIVSLVVVIVLILLLGRAFCAYVCPTPIVNKLRKAVSKKPKPEEGSKMSLTAQEKKWLKGCKGGCSSCQEVSKKAIDSRHFVLGGALLSAAIFGFPVFCLICPIGLTFATIFLLILLFGGGDVTIAVIVCPLILILEVCVFRKWCSHICPISALMSLVAKGNKTFVPQVDPNKCINCGTCKDVCDQCIDPHDLANGAPMSECTKCRACVDNCPTKAITMPFFPQKKKKELQEEAEETK